MSALLDDLRHILTRHHQHVTGQTNQGTAHLIEAHLKALETAAGTESADHVAHAVLGSLYGALNAPVPETPPVAAHAVETVIVGEHGPELALPEPAHAEPEPDEPDDEHGHPETAV